MASRADGWWLVDKCVNLPVARFVHPRRLLLCSIGLTWLKMYLVRTHCGYCACQLSTANNFVITLMWHLLVRTSSSAQLSDLPVESSKISKRSWSIFLIFAYFSQSLVYFEKEEIILFHQTLILTDLMNVSWCPTKICFLPKYFAVEPETNILSY